MRKSFSYKTFDLKHFPSAFFYSFIISFLIFVLLLFFQLASLVWAVALSSIFLLFSSVIMCREFTSVWLKDNLSNLYFGFFAFCFSFTIIDLGVKIVLNPSKFKASILSDKSKLGPYIFSLIISLVSMFMYKQHNQFLSQKLVHLLNTKTEPLVSQVNASNSLLSLQIVFLEIPKLGEYGTSIGEKLGHEFEKEIISAILEEQIRFLGEKHRTMSRDTYLQILQKFNSKYEELFCINKTLPIYWFSPFPDERGFIDEYTNQKSDIKTTRYTLVKSKNDLLNQFQNAFEVVKRWEEKDIAYWGLVLFYRILYKKLNKHWIKNLIMKIRILGSKGRKNNIYRIVNVFGRVISGLDKSFKKDLLSIFMEQKGTEFASEKIQQELEKNQSEAKKIALNLKNLVQSQDCAILNRGIIEKFVEIHKASGSFFIIKDNVKKYFQKYDVSIEDYGEYGAYLDKNGAVKRAFATIGDFGAIIRLKILSDGEQLLKGFKYIQNMSLGTGRGENIANMGKLYED